MSDRSPILKKIYGDSAQTYELRSLLIELFIVLTFTDTTAGCSRAVEFLYKNGKKGKAVLLSSVKNKTDFFH